MQWGLLQGLGKGLNQFGGNLNQGMNIDIQAQRQEESEQRRQASIEKRWQAQENRADRQEQAQATRWAKQDERQASQDARQIERDAVSDSQFDRRMSAQDVQAIERNLSGVMEQANNAAEDIENRYAKLAVDSLGQPLPKAQLDALLEEKKKEIKAVRTQYATLVDNYVKSYGDKLRGTGFAYLLDVPDIEEASEKKATPPSNQGQVSIDDLFNKALSSEAKATPITGMVEDLETGEMVEAAGTKPRKATFLNAFADSLGGSYNYEARPITDDKSPFEVLSTAAGGLLGYIPGQALDKLEIANAEVVQPLLKYGNTKPSQR